MRTGLFRFMAGPVGAAIGPWGPAGHWGSPTPSASRTARSPGRRPRTGRSGETESLETEFQRGTPAGREIAVFGSARRSRRPNAVGPRLPLPTRRPPHFVQPQIATPALAGVELQLERQFRSRGRRVGIAVLGQIERRLAQQPAARRGASNRRGSKPAPNAFQRPWFSQTSRATNSPVAAACCKRKLAGSACRAQGKSARADAGVGMYFFSGLNAPGNRSAVALRRRSRPGGPGRSCGTVPSQRHGAVILRFFRREAAGENRHSNPLGRSTNAPERPPACLGARPAVPDDVGIDRVDWRFTPFPGCGESGWLG